MVKKNSGSTPFSTSVCSGSFQSSSAQGRFRHRFLFAQLTVKSNGRSQPLTTSFFFVFIASTLFINFTSGIHYHVIIIMYVSWDAPFFRRGVVWFDVLIMTSASCAQSIKATTLVYFSFLNWTTPFLQQIFGSLRETLSLLLEYPKVVSFWVCFCRISSSV